MIWICVLQQCEHALLSAQARASGELNWGLPQQPGRQLPRLPRADRVDGEEIWPWHRPLDEAAQRGSPGLRSAASGPPASAATDGANRVETTRGGRIRRLRIESRLGDLSD